MSDVIEATISHRAADVVLAEVRRARDLQSARIGNLRSTASVQIGAAGIAAGLASAAADNPWWLIPLGLLAMAVLAGVATIATRSSDLVNPRGVLEQAIGEDALQVKVDAIDGVIGEYEYVEAQFKWPARISRMGTVLFVLGIVCLAAVAGYGAAVAEPAAPTEVRIVEVVQ